MFLNKCISGQFINVCVFYNFKHIQLAIIIYSSFTHLLGRGLEISQPTFAIRSYFRRAPASSHNQFQSEDELRLIVLYKIVVMENTKEYKRHVLYFLFQSGENATKATEKLNRVHGENFISTRTVQKWFKKFKSGTTDVEDKPRSGRPVEFDNEALKKLVDAEPQLNVDQIAERLNSSHATVHRHLQEIGKLEKSKKQYQKPLK